MDIIKKALDRGAKNLTEYDSKKILKKYKIPVTSEKTVTDVEDAVRFADEIGYPVVLKGSGEELSHKTELNLVHLNLNNEESVRKSFNELISNQKAGVKEVLVQEMITGDRELLIGLTRDVQYGPCVMFGLGGIFTEIHNDVTFKIAPLSKYDAMEMMEEIRGKKILGSFRGKTPIDREILAEILINIGQLGLENSEIKEIDINPLKIKNGKPVAVDALIVLEK